MAITNAEILFDAGQRLLEEGKLKPTGRTFTFQFPDGSTVEVPEPEPFHTFQFWKAHGYKVRKGEHAIARITIWKYGEKKGKDEDEEKAEAPAERGHCFKKEACFFAFSQVDPA